MLHKGHFVAMSGAAGVVGQFNLGFIIGRLGSDLFILDQHACDEKFNFERLRAHTRIHEQQLLVPRAIDLTAAEELTVMAHLGAFNANGFHFAVDRTAPAGRRVRLTAVPFSKNITFGDEDVRELCSTLAEWDGGDDSERAASHACAEGTCDAAAAPAPLPLRPLPRLPKITAMFASRACRGSIMIGEALERRTMRQVVAHLAELEHPWACPHGRPTLRHLVDVGAPDGEGGEGGVATRFEAAGSPFALQFSLAEADGEVGGGGGDTGVHATAASPEL